MNSTWLNVRILLWHIQILKGHLIRPTISFNRWWWRWELLRRPFAIYDLNPKEGWRERRSTCWIPHE